MKIERAYTYGLTELAAQNDCMSSLYHSTRSTFSFPANFSVRPQINATEAEREQDHMYDYTIKYR